MCKSKAVHSQFNGTAFWAGGVIDWENVGKGQPNKRRTYELSSRHRLAFCHEQPLGSLGKPIGLSGVGKRRHCPSAPNAQPLYAWRAPILKESLPPEALPQKIDSFLQLKILYPGDTYWIERPFLHQCMESMGCDFSRSI